MDSPRFVDETVPVTASRRIHLHHHIVAGDCAALLRHKNFSEPHADAGSGDHQPRFPFDRYGLS